MKKLLCACLSIALIFTLLCPLNVLAQPDEEPEVPAATERSNETFWGRMGYETVEELMEWIVGEYWYDRNNCEAFWRVWGDYSKDSFLEFNDVDEDEYQVLEEAWQKAWKEAEKQQYQRKMQELGELGGTPGIVNVMFNGGFIKFNGAVPEIIGGSTFVPMKAFFESMGAVVSYDTQTREIIAEFEDLSVGFLAGRDTMSITEGGTTRERPIDLAPYIVKGVSYIPVRAVAEALGFKVYWDWYFGAVVIIDKKKIAEEINKDFTIINSLLDMPVGTLPVDKTTYKTVTDMLISATRFDSLDGDKKADSSAKITTVTDGQNISMTGKIDLSALINLILAEYSEYSAEYSDYLYDEGLPEIIGQLKTLGEITAEIIFNYNEGMLYAKAPILSEFFPELPEDAWLSISALDEYSEIFDLASIMEVLGFGDFAEGISVGTIITSGSQYSSYYDQVHIYDKFISNAKVVKALIGDDKFVKKNNDYTIKLTREDIFDILDESSEFYRMLIGECDLLLTIKTGDGKITGISGNFVVRAGATIIGTVIRIACKFDVNPGKVRFSLEVHLKNALVVLIGIESNSVETNAPIPAAPPEGAVIVPIDGFIGAGSEYWPDLVQQLSLIT